MALLVQKYGGTSVADADRIRTVADYVARTKRAGNDVVVVVSAMGKTTDELVRLANDVSGSPAAREMDMLLSTGERVSVALLSMALRDLGFDARSYTGSQAEIITDSTHTKAKILEVRATRIRELLDGGGIPVVAGFQGVSADTKDVTTIGRGGSDPTAVALAAALGADACELYTDVSGIYTADPRVVPEARRIPEISFDELLEMTACGCPKPEMRSVELARTHHVPLHIRSSFTWEPGTWVKEIDETMEQPIISAVVPDTSEAKVTVRELPDHPGVAADLFGALAERSVNVDMIEQNVSVHGTTDISFTVPLTDLAAAREVSESLLPKLGGTEVLADSDIGRISLVGAGMKSNPGVAATMFRTLADEGINIEMISTSAIRISCVIRAEKVDGAVRALHAAFDLASERPRPV